MIVIEKEINAVWGVGRRGGGTVPSFPATPPWSPTPIKVSGKVPI